MITLHMHLLPYGQSIGRRSIVEGSIWTTDDNKFHAYRLVQDDRIIHEGRVEKTMSGHANPFNLLLNIAKDVLDV